MNSFINERGGKGKGGRGVEMRRLRAGEGRERGGEEGRRGGREINEGRERVTREKGERERQGQDSQTTFVF